MNKLLNIQASPKKGLSIERETFLLKKIARELVSTQSGALLELSE